MTDYMMETLYTDSIAWEVIGRTAKTITVRGMDRGDVIASDGFPYPVVTYAALPDPAGPVLTLRVRKDGSFRTGPGARPLRPVDNPRFVTDYRY